MLKGNSHSSSSSKNKNNKISNFYSMPTLRQEFSCVPVCSSK